MNDDCPNIPLNRLVPGYPKLAGQMETLPEIAIFRKFAALNARNLLYMQADLTSLEKKLVELETEDYNRKGGSERYAADWYWLSQSADQGVPEQLDLVLKLREVLRSYNEALIQQATIHNLSPPDRWDLKYIQGFMDTSAMGPLGLAGDDGMIWGSTTDPKFHAVDLITLRARKKSDAFSTWLAETALGNMVRCGCARWKKPSRIHGVVGYRDSTISRITRWITTILASMIPLASIVVLFYVRSTTGRLCVIGGFNLLITVCLSGFTTSKRSEIFAISAAQVNPKEPDKSLSNVYADSLPFR